MKLTSWPAAVKPESTLLVGTLLSALIAALGLLFVWSRIDEQVDRMERFGRTSAQILGELCVEPMLKRDLLHLGVISNRLASMEEIAAVAAYDADDVLLTVSGSQAGPQYSQTISFEGSVIGRVQVALDPAAFESGIMAPENRSTVILLSLFIIIASAFGTTFTIVLVRTLRSGELRITLPRLKRTPQPTIDTATVDGDWEAEPEAEPPSPEPQPHYLLGINLYNLLGLKNPEREFELSLCTELAEAIALAYGGQVVSLPNLGALIDFAAEPDAADRPFHVVRAAYALSRLLRDESPFGVYRLGLHLVEYPGAEPLPLDHAGIKDVALLSALARDYTFAMSEAMTAVVPGPERLVARPMVNLLLEELETSGSQCRLVTDLDDDERPALLQQVERLKSQRDAITSESTF